MLKSLFEFDIMVSLFPYTARRCTTVVAPPYGELMFIFILLTSIILQLYINCSIVSEI
ncbi:hypothetical protein HanIR_Chr11g0543581 [Helianthus annuus]|nr:hypothetical protein HanIR_Chr11g0543581 [Helianthus annuus]